MCLQAEKWLLLPTTAHGRRKPIPCHRPRFCSRVLRSSRTMLGVQEAHVNYVDCQHQDALTRAQKSRFRSALYIQVGCKEPSPWHGELQDREAAQGWPRTITHSLGAKYSNVQLVLLRDIQGRRGRNQGPGYCMALRLVQLLWKIPRCFCCLKVQCKNVKGENRALLMWVTASFPRPHCGSLGSSVWAAGQRAVDGPIMEGGSVWTGHAQSSLQRDKTHTWNLPRAPCNSALMRAESQGEAGCRSQSGSENTAPVPAGVRKGTGTTGVSLSSSGF